MHNGRIPSRAHVHPPGTLPTPTVAPTPGRSQLQSVCQPRAAAPTCRTVGRPEASWLQTSGMEWSMVRWSRVGDNLLTMCS